MSETLDPGKPFGGELNTSRSKLIRHISEELSNAAASEADKSIRLIDLGLASLPQEAIELLRNANVGRLSLQKNNLSTLPPYFYKLTNLRYLDLHDNGFTEFPSVLSQCPSLEILDLSFNKISSLPDNLNYLRNLKVLSLKNNNLKVLPLEILQMSNLKILEIEENPLVLPPTQVLHTFPPPHTEEWMEAIRSYLSQNAELITAKQRELQGADMGPSGMKKPEGRSSKRNGIIGDELNAETILSPVEIKTPVAQHFKPKPHGLAIEPPKVRSRSRSSPLLPQFMESRTPVDDPGKLESMEHLAAETSKSQDYFKRLSTLPEEDANGENTVASPVAAVPVVSSLQQQHFNKIIATSRRLLFAFTETQTNVRKFATFCSDKALAMSTITLLYSARNHIDNMVEHLEVAEKLTTKQNVDVLVSKMLMCISVFKQIVALLQKNFDVFFSASRESYDIPFVRTFFLNVFGSYCEMFNAWNTLFGKNKSPRKGSAALLSSIPAINTAVAPTAPPVQSTPPNEQQEIDERLFETIKMAINTANVVYSQLTESITKAAISSANSEGAPEITGSIASHIKELTDSCFYSIELSKKLSARLQVISTSETSSTVKRKDWEDMNTFLKSIIVILGSSKSLIKELPSLNEVKPILASLAKITKDVTVILDLSSYRYVASSSAGQGAAAAIPAPPEIFTPYPGQIPPEFSMHVPNPPSTPSLMNTTSNPFEASLMNHIHK